MLITIAGILFAFAWALGVAAIAIGISRSDAMVNPHFTKAQEMRYIQSEIVTIALFFAVEIAMASIIVRSGILGLARIHWVVQLAGMTTIGIALAYAAVVLSLGVGGFPDPIDEAYRAWYHWIMG